jgi:ribose transport system substrate-binding protein
MSRSRITLPVGVALAAALVAATAGCSSISSGDGSTAPEGALSANCGEDKTFRIGFAQANNAEPYRQQVNRELEAFAADYPEFDISIADGQGNSSKQVSDVENFQTQQVDLLLISPFEAQPLTAVVTEVYESGIPVIELDRQTADDNYTAFVGGDNEAIGRAAGEYVATELLPDGGDVAILEGLESSTPAVQRTEGFQAGVATNPGINVVAVQPADWLPDKAQTVFDAMLRANPGIKAVYANNDLMANGAYLALKAQDKVGEVAIIGTDGLTDPAGGAQAVADGIFDATFVYPTGAKEALELAHQILVECATADDIERNTVVPTTLINSDNAQAFLDAANKE